MGDQASLKKLIFPLILATALHVVLINLNISLPLKTGEGDEQNVISLTQIDPEVIKRLRTIGVKNGNKDFSSPLKKGGLDIASLAPKKIKKVKRKQKGPSFKGPGQPKNLLTVVNSGNVDLGVSPSVLKAFKATNLNVAFEPPEGVEESELNSVEKKFYGFSKRTYELYVSSLIKSINNIMRDRPQLNFQAIEGSFDLVGRIAFNSEGDAISTRFLQVAKNDDVQQLFENTLMDIRVIPNPPRELIKKDGTFSIYYKLRVGL